MCKEAISYSICPRARAALSLLYFFSYFLTLHKVGDKCWRFAQVILTIVMWRLFNIHRSCDMPRVPCRVLVCFSLKYQQHGAPPGRMKTLRIVCYQDYPSTGFRLSPVLFLHMFIFNHSYTCVHVELESQCRIYAGLIFMCLVGVDLRILQGPYYSKFLVPNHIAGALIGIWIAHSENRRVIGESSDG